MDKKIYAVPLFIFSAFMIALYLVVPEYKQYMVKMRSITQLQKDIENKQVYYNNLKQVRADLNDYQPVLDKIDEAIPASLFSAEFLNYFQSVASDSGLLLSSISVGEEAIATAGSERIRTSSSNVILIGSVNSFYNFLKTIEKSTRFFEVDLLTVSLDPEADDMNNFNVAIKTFSY